MYALFLAFRLLMIAAAGSVMLALGWLMRATDLNVFIFLVICLVCMVLIVARRLD